MVGRVKVYEEEVAPGCRVRVLELLELLKTTAPVLLDEVPRVRDEAPVKLALAAVTPPTELTVKLVNPIKLVLAVVPDKMVSQPVPTLIALEPPPPTTEARLMPVPEVVAGALSCKSPTPA